MTDCRMFTPDGPCCRPPGHKGRCSRCPHHQEEPLLADPAPEGLSQEEHDAVRKLHELAPFVQHLPPCEGDPCECGLRIILNESYR